MPAQRLSADEAIAKFRETRPDHAREVGGTVAIAKGARAAPSWDKDARTARFCMTTQQVDRYGDIVVTSGIDTTEFEKNPTLLLFHNSRTWPIGTWANLEKQLRGRPPRMDGDAVLLPEGAPAGLGDTIAETAWMLDQGGIKACSIGFIPDWEEVEGITDEDGYWTGFRFMKSELTECSIVAIPANPGALVKAGGQPTLAKDLVEDVLDNWARSPQGVIMPRAAWEKAYGEAVAAVKADEVAPVRPKADVIPPEPRAAPDALQDDAKAKAVDAIVIDVDTGVAEQKLNGIIDLAKRAGDALKRALGLTEGHAAAEEPPTPPAPEAIEAARTKGADKLAQLKERGLI